MGHAIVERVLLFGTRSADYIRASGHSGRIAMEASPQAKIGRIHDRTRTLRRKSDLLLHRGRRPYMTLINRCCNCPLQCSTGSVQLPDVEAALSVCPGTY
jgi:hypothetical protein